MKPRLTTSIDGRSAALLSASSAMLAIVLVALVAISLRVGTNVRSLPPTFDEPWIIVPINDLVAQGWSMRTAIDFEETKGPGLIWTYALIGKWLGGSLNDLRLVSVFFFVLGVVPLIEIGRLCKMTSRSLGLIVAGYLVLPYHAPLGQLVMSEPSYVALSLAACWVAVRGMTVSADQASVWPSWLGPALLTIVLIILLHNRVHAAALAGAIILTSIQHLGPRRAAPWVAACVVAGLARIPLWIHWGGLVSPRWQQAMDLGFSLSPGCYLLAALAPVMAVFMVALLLERTLRSSWMIVGLAALSGSVLTLLSRPDLAAFTPMDDQNLKHFSGMIATAARTLAPESSGWQTAMVAVAAASAAGGLASLWLLCHARTEFNSTLRLVLVLQCWLVSIGLGLYLLVSAPAFDRYILGWIVLLPVAWIALLPRWLLAIELLLLAAACAWLCRQWLL